MVYQRCFPAHHISLVICAILLMPPPTCPSIFNDIFWTPKSITKGPVEVYYESIHSSEGSVDAGNYTYYTLKQPGTIRLVLTPLFGDPDLYISEGGGSNPSFMPEEYASSSASCGLERIDIMRLFKRPINIAVYGHPYYEKSQYRLEVLVAQTEEDDPFLYSDGTDDELGGSSRQQSKRSSDSSPGYDEAISWASFAWEIIRSILELLIEILL